MIGKIMSEKKENKETTSKGQWHGGKGSIQKPTNQDKYAEAWEKIFGKNKGPSKFDKQGTVHYRDGDNT
jgi:DNA gyrase inhibitor GyrI